MAAAPAVTNPSSTQVAATRGKARSAAAWTSVMTVLLLASITTAVTIGSANIGALDVWRSIAIHIGVNRFGVDAVPLPRLRDGIVWDIRLPRVLAAAAVGAALALCGSVMQTLVRNRLADPYLLGLSSGASVGAVVVLVVGVGWVALPAAAFGGALLALVGTLGLANHRGVLTPGRTVLAGLAVSYLCTAITSFVIFWSASNDSYREILSWLLGSLGGASWLDVAIVSAAVGVIGTVMLGYSRQLDGFAFGDTLAATLGISVNRTRWILLALVAVLTGAAVAVSGAIGFVGLMVPHAVRFVVGSSHRRIMPLAALAGASFMVWADTIARTLFDPRELPVGVVTALLGAPAFAVLLHRRRVGP